MNMDPALSQETITVSCPSRDLSYPILVGWNHLARLPEVLKTHNLNAQLFIVTDSHVADLHLASLENVLKDFKKKVFILEPGEENKSLETINDIAENMIHSGLTRDSILVAFGGGVLGDIVAFLASILMRGLQIIHIPTSLIAQIDSAIGGKTAVNLPVGKNLLGTFHFPALVFVETSFLCSLPHRHLVSGLGEVAKYACLSSRDFFSSSLHELHHFLTASPEKMTKIVAQCIRYKADIVSQDPWDTKGIRVILNLGHTFAHAIESFAEYDDEYILHGEAVAVGLSLSAYLSHTLGYLSQEDYIAIEHYLNVAGLPSRQWLIHEGISLKKDLLPFMKRDKKNTQHTDLNLVLLKTIGHAFLTHDHSINDILKGLI